MQPRRPAPTGPSLGHCLELTSPGSLAPLPRSSCVTRAQVAADYSIATFARREKPDLTMSRTAGLSVLPKISAVAHASVKNFNAATRNPKKCKLAETRVCHSGVIPPRLSSIQYPPRIGKRGRDG